MESPSQEFAVSALDRHFARFIAAFADGGEGVFAAAALLSMTTRSGHSCLELRAWAGKEPHLGGGQLCPVPELSRWRQILAECPAVGAGQGNTPLIMENDRLYLRRYWVYEEEVARGFLQRGQAAWLPVDEKLLLEGLKCCFSATPDSNSERQRLAVLVAMWRPLTVITGGPGVGKTTTVAMILALLSEQYQARGELLRVALAAPTGKAAMRLQESISGVKMWRLFKDRLPGDFLPGEVMTVHRLLGGGGASRSFRFDESNPLPYDLVVVDEASMIDLPMMAKLFRALQAETRLILLGDRHQLASVEPGSVLGDLCHPAALLGCTPELSARLGTFGISFAPTPRSGEGNRLADSLVELRHSHRFASEGGIGRLGEAVRSGDVAGAWKVLLDPAVVDVVWRDVVSPEGLDESMFALIPEGFRELPGLPPGEALAANDRFRILCAVRQGPFGAEQMNYGLERFLERQGYRVAAGHNYPGRPVMVLRNDYELRLYNGDMGIMLPDIEQFGELKVFFSDPGGGVRKFSPARLPPHQTVYAMTVHKSQGSEFDRILLILPEHYSPPLSRELLFTAITRARIRVEIWGKRQVFEQAVVASSERHSGLREKLWGDLPEPPGR